MNNKKEPKSFSERFDKHYLLLTLLWFLLLGGSIALLVIFIKHQILGVLFAFTTLACAIMVVINYKKAILEGTFEEGLFLFFVAIGKAITLLIMPLIKLLTKLGFLGGRLNNANDEHSFIFDFAGRAGRSRADKMPKWKNLTDNIQRVRYIFMKHINYRIKKGYRFKKTLTPNEIEKELQPLLKEDEDISLLFDNYRLARYENGDRVNFDDDLVEKLKELY